MPAQPRAHNDAALSPTVSSRSVPTTKTPSTHTPAAAEGAPFDIERGHTRLRKGRPALRLDALPIRRRGRSPGSKIEISPPTPLHPTWMPTVALGVVNRGLHSGRPATPSPLGTGQKTSSAEEGSPNGVCEGGANRTVEDVEDAVQGNQLIRQDRRLAMIIDRTADLENRTAGRGGYGVATS